MTIRPEHGLVLTQHEAATQAGMEMLLRGGTAVDAAVAAAFTLGVVTPGATGIAGYGGCAMIYLAERGETVAVDFNCKAPAAARPDMFPVRVGEDGTVSVEERVNEHGPLAIDVPGMVGGLCCMQESFGTLPRSEVIQPAVRAARDGFQVNRATARMIEVMLYRNAERYPEAFRLYAPQGRPPEAGETIRTPELARTLELIAAGGAAAFYSGEIARAITGTVRAAGGILTEEDLASYRPKVGRPLSAQYRGQEVCTMPLTSGGLTVLQMLRVLEGFDVRATGGGPAFAHLMIEVGKVCFRRRLTRHGDPDFAPLDMEQELGEALIREMRQEVAVGLGAPQPGRIVGPANPGGTVTLTTVDRIGNIVAMTITHGEWFGSLMGVPGTGLVLSHGMSRFDPRPGWPNSVAPGKRPLHNMNPVIVFRDGRPAAAVGAAGGRTIMTNVAQVIARLTDLGATPAEALAAQRWHVETAEPVRVEPEAEDLKEALERLGHRVVLEPLPGKVQAVTFGPEPGCMRASIEPRAEGKADWR